MSETLNYDYPPGASPQEIWAILREVAEGHKEDRLRMQETDRQMQETRLQMQETDRRMQETDRQIQETDRIVKETAAKVRETTEQMKITDKKIGELTNRFGELAEHLVAPSIREKFNALGFSFGEVSREKEIVDAQGNSVAEIDILLENGDTVMVVEVKAKIKQNEVDKHIKRLEILRSRADARNDRRTFMGAIASAIMPKELRAYIIKSGFYAIEQTGDTVVINVPEGFTPRQW
jgi:hypothetical protein